MAVDTNTESKVPKAKKELVILPLFLWLVLLSLRVPHHCKRKCQLPMPMSMSMPMPMPMPMPTNVNVDADADANANANQCQCQSRNADASHGHTTHSRQCSMEFHGIVCCISCSLIILLPVWQLLQLLFMAIIMAYSRAVHVYHYPYLLSTWTQCTHQSSRYAIRSIALATSPSAFHRIPVDWGDILGVNFCKGDVASNCVGTSGFCDNVMVGVVLFLSYLRLFSNGLYR